MSEEQELFLVLRTHVQEHGLPAAWKAKNDPLISIIPISPQKERRAPEQLPYARSFSRSQSLAFLRHVQAPDVFLRSEDDEAQYENRQTQNIRQRSLEPSCSKRHDAGIDENEEDADFRNYCYWICLKTASLEKRLRP